MEFVLRCNNLKCRVQLHDRAVVTTCSHIFCTKCADATGLARSTNAERLCPACSSSLQNPDDVVIAGLVPSEAYQSSILSGLSPAIVLECASRGLAFYNYQSSQEIIYQEHLAKGLSDKYNTLSQQMDQLIHEANSQLKGLHDKIHGMQAEYASLEGKHNELYGAFKEKTKSLQQTQKQYQQLKAQVMASHVAIAAGDQAELPFNPASGSSFKNHLSGVRVGSANLGQPGVGFQTEGARLHNRNMSRSSGSGGPGGGPGGGIGIGPSYASQLQGRELGNRVHSARTASIGTPPHLRGSRLPVLGGARQNPLVNTGPSYQASPMMRTPMLNGVAARNLGNFTLGSKTLKRA